MLTLEALSLPSARLLTLTLIHLLWEGLVVAAIVKLALHAVTTSRTRYAITIGGLFAMSICPLVTFAILNQADHGTSVTQISELGSINDAADFGASDRATSWIREPESAGLYSLVQPYLLAIWLSGVSLLSLKLALSVCSIQWLQLGRRPIPQELAARLVKLGDGLGRKAEQRVFLSQKVHDALVVGFLRPAVLLPASWLSELPVDAIEAIVAHELAHIRRWDLWVNLWQRGVETVLFYHPAVWWLSRCVRVEREMCCDELAVAATGKRIVYANALELAARRRIAARQPALAAALRGENRMSLLRRVENVLDVAPTQHRLGWLPLLLLMAVAGAAFVATTGVFDPAATAVFADDADDEPDRDRARDNNRDPDRRDRPHPERHERDGDRDRPPAEHRNRDSERDRPHPVHRIRNRPHPDRVERDVDRNRPHPDRVERDVDRNRPHPDRVERDGDRNRPHPVRVERNGDRNRPHPDRVERNVDRNRPHPDRVERDGDRNRPHPEHRNRDGDRDRPRDERGGDRRHIEHRGVDREGPLPATARSPREANILQIVMQLQREIANLRTELQELREHSGHRIRAAESSNRETNSRSLQPPRNRDQNRPRREAGPIPTNDRPHPAREQATRQRAEIERQRRGEIERRVKGEPQRRRGGEESNREDAEQGDKKRERETRR